MNQQVPVILQRDALFSDRDPGTDSTKKLAPKLVAENAAKISSEISITDPVRLGVLTLKCSRT